METPGLYKTKTNCYETFFTLLFLKTLSDKFAGGPVGVKNIATALGEDDGTIEDVVEPYLIQLGFVERTSRGRMLTEKGKEYLEK